MKTPDFALAFAATAPNAAMARAAAHNRLNMTFPPGSA
jgi:hypothetical protein